ncbi:3-ketoacyl-CoA thiolase protein [Marine Group I thaumarchaeote SCGC AAA799-B03]|uniref:3-ketoacyl-CoA thiolase protein n=3 Tax=Marine Group I TaxID=905826 RepID=A0A087S8H3_9ARCH|nr:3-ketoacyl-CoA thiolase protein [Marine Group I thaumarchaeote SCGC AAA799-N04]KFM18053.1 3-oxoacyl-acyl-carrier-protein synthase 3 [Marine Group I thaumarchaeote SCGC RSA3]KFM22027.1 3-ketoacyl-CoA thiolase protein [Marine Group I thaumarchaeote SCGC AAA799-B03]
MNKVGIAAYGITPFTKDDKKIESILLESAKNLFENNSSIQKEDIDAVLVSTNNNSKYLAPVLSETLGIQPKTAHSIENLCNSGTNSIVSAYSYIASGLANVVLVSGAERYDSPGQILEWDNSRGEFKHPIFWASIFTSSYKRKFNVTDEQLAIVPVKNHNQSQNNPNALSKKTYTIQDVMNSKKITDDLRLLDCSRSCTGSASLVLASENIMKKITDQPIWISGIGQKTISAGFTKNESFYSMESTKAATQTALQMADKKIQDVDVVEVHDAFSVCEPMALEALGLSDPGEGLTLVKKLYETRNLKINPRGGLIGCGHPLGATGIAQTIEITQQLQSNAKNRQVENANVGIVHNMSAAATSSTVLVLEK